jgi:excisionase family DNA binding protein
MTVTEEERRPFSPKKLAEHWHCSERHVRNLIARGEIRSFRLGGKLLRIAWEEVDRFEREGGSK